MSEKMGEGIIQSAFSNHLRTRTILKHGLEAPYVDANLQGKHDKKFADYFASVNSINVLIEFKELDHEWVDEKYKPLRNDLCALLLNKDRTKLLNYSALGHFIAWGDCNDKIENIQSYSQKICPIFKIDDPYPGAIYTEKEFINGFLENTIGLGIKKMNEYVRFMAQIAAQGETQEECPKIRMLLCSFDIKKDDFIKTPFDNLCELQKALKLRPGNEPSGPSK